MFLRLTLLTLSLCLVAGGAGCAMFQKPKAEDLVDPPVTPEQAAWWDANRSKARYVPGRGWYVEGTSGYFDEEGRPMRDKKAPDPRSIEDDGRDWPFSKYLSLDENTKRFKKLIGKGPNEPLAKQADADGDTLFRAEKYHEAAKKYEIAYERWPDSPLEEEAFYKAGEAYFFANEYPMADDVYSALMKKYQGTSHLDNVSARRFAIARYWEAKYDQNPRWPFTPQWKDKTQPHFDTAGHALKCYENIRLQDPTGPLADDAVMTTANFHFTHSHWEDADYWYRHLREEFPKSEHQFNAHFFGLQASLHRYQGAYYTDKPLETSDDIADQLLAQFDRELGDDKESVLKARAEVQAQYALREFQMGEYYYNTKWFGAAKAHFRNVVEEYPQTRLAEDSRKRIDDCKGKPEVPTPPFAWLEAILPKSKRIGPSIANVPPPPKSKANPANVAGNSPAGGAGTPAAAGANPPAGGAGNPPTNVAGNPPPVTR